MFAACRASLLLLVVFSAEQGRCQNFFYVEPGNPSCPAVSAPTPATTPPTVQTGIPVSGSIGVSCGLDRGSYTVTLSSTDPGAGFAPRTFLVNFGAIVGDGVFSVTFATAGVQTVAAHVTSNMGSPAAVGRFASLTNEFNVVRP
jgi:hypothetical protein